MARKRLIILDALRAIAGLSVPLFHLCDPLAKRADAPIESIVGHGYLAVEFFLLMMGYMLGYAYDRRWNEGMTLVDFFKRRLVRLHPLVVSGVALGLFVVLAQPEPGVWVPWFKDVGKVGVLGIALWAVTMVPVIGFGMINPFNACSWTLYYEYAGNILYALVIRRLNKVMLWGGVIVSAFFWLTFAFHVNLNHVFGTDLPFFTKISNYFIWSVAGGWAAKDIQVYAGFVRLGFPLFFGLLLSRLGWKINLTKGALWITVAMFLAVLCTPYAYKLGGASHPWVNPLFEVFALMVVFPLLIMIGVGSKAKESTLVAKVFAFFAELSYPLYMSHYMFMYIYNWWVRTHSNEFSDSVVLMIACVIYLALIGFASFVMVCWDRPIQRWLTSGRKMDRQ